MTTSPSNELLGLLGGAIALFLLWDLKEAFMRSRMRVGGRWITAQEQPRMFKLCVAFSAVLAMLTVAVTFDLLFNLDVRNLQ